MQHSRQVKVTCPLCGVAQWRTLMTGWQVIHCDMDEVPGCEAAFAVRIHVREIIDVVTCKLTEMRCESVDVETQECVPMDGSARALP